MNNTNRESFIEVEDVKGNKLKLPNVPFRLQKKPGQIRFPGLPHGSANDVIVTDILKYNSKKIANLKSAKVI